MRYAKVRSLLKRKYGARDKVDSRFSPVFAFTGFGEDKIAFKVQPTLMIADFFWPTMKAVKK